MLGSLPITTPNTFGGGYVVAEAIEDLPMTRNEKSAKHIDKD
jgi:hypothetical protein